MTKATTNIHTAFSKAIDAAISHISTISTDWYRDPDEISTYYDFKFLGGNLYASFYEDIGGNGYVKCSIQSPEHGTGDKHRCIVGKSDKLPEAPSPADIRLAARVAFERAISSDRWISVDDLMTAP